jgi:hypothetical protein
MGNNMGQNSYISHDGILCRGQNTWEQLDRSLHEVDLSSRGIGLHSTLVITTSSAAKGMGTTSKAGLYSALQPLAITTHQRQHVHNP